MSRPEGREDREGEELEKKVNEERGCRGKKKFTIEASGMIGRCKTKRSGHGEDRPEKEQRKGVGV